MDEKAREDLELIRRMMQDGRREVVDRGKHFLIWGLVPVVGLLATYAKATSGWGPDPRLVWLLVLGVGWASSMIVGRRDGRRARVSTLARRILSATWVATGVSLTMIATAGMFGALDVRLLPGLLAAIIAAPVLVSGMLTGEKWLLGVALAWWAGGALMLFVPGPYTLLVMAGMSLVLLALPGAILGSRAGRREAVGQPVVESS